jgi:bifunctional enzyme CysN/CysC
MLRRPNDSADSLTVNREARAALKQQRPTVLWLTGGSEPVISEIAKRVDERLHLLKRHTFLLDGRSLNGSSGTARIEHIRRLGEIAKLMTDAGLIVITACILPSLADRELIRGMLDPGEFVEAYVGTDEALTKRRRLGSRYKMKMPAEPEIFVDTASWGPAQAAKRIVDALLAAPAGISAGATGASPHFDMSYS